MPSAISDQAASSICKLVASSAQNASSTARNTTSNLQSNPRTADGDARRRVTVLYSHLPFLAVGNIHRVPFEDVNYLESCGCLHVPARPLLDNFVEQYFLHIHPLLPLVDEGDFWEMYSEVEAPCPPDNRMPLLLFQAMLFSSCALLYDFDAEIDQLPLAQASLLLMHWVPPSNFPSSPYKTWLGRALQHAKSINADRYGAMPKLPAWASPDARKYHKACRRMWWCCIILDRISPLSGRYGNRITRDTFDFAKATALGAADLEDEIYRSSVYSPAAKRRLIGLFEVYLKFTLLLTDVLTLVFPFEDSLRMNHQPCDEDGAQIEICDAALKSWFAVASEKFRPFQGTSRTAAGGLGKQELHRSEALHVNLMYIYYYTAKIAIHHYLLLYRVANGHELEIADLPQVDKLAKSRDELMDAAAHMTLLFGELSRRRLVRWLPVSTLACMTMPLALGFISARLFTTGKGPASNRPVAASDSRAGLLGLDVLSEALEAFVSQYQCVGYIREVAKHVANLAQDHSSQAGDQPRTLQDSKPGRPLIITDWIQVLTAQPCVYVWTTMAVDLYIRDCLGWEGRTNKAAASGHVPDD
ncbi:uncharacterized protein B0I36DRAFT_436093 [Microdochium trichocladiopsis]|uniref:Transcription factor domain-containing protein n=1 Tax=Microdochium trichocladiopsis TaxID=1682393 RepID=A0A9P8XUX6_9PEZI|nr:uncharacterized protein B0I36DRAFT_436093 [Microdochium trichocladiopsis]KAH7016409.1 hypothetical protein B0I36DRAFT_436093 [Microdochium trichocladiopsis]